MAEKRFKLELFFPELYQEIELNEEAAVIGTTRNCNIRLQKESFFHHFEVRCVRDRSGNWGLHCVEGCCLRTDSPLKLQALSLDHGVQFEVQYLNGGAPICKGQFVRDFEQKKSEYSDYISLNEINRILLGNRSGCQVLIQDESILNEQITVQRTGQGWQLLEQNTRYGVTINGKRINGAVPLQDYDFFSYVGHSFFLRGDRLYFTRSSQLTIHGLQVLSHHNSASALTYPHLNRSTRVYFQLPTEEIEIQDPPSKQAPPEQNLLVSLLPALAMLGVTVLLRGVLGGGGTFVIFSVCTMSIGMITSVFNHFNQKKKSAAREEKRVADYSAYIQGKEAEIQNARVKELTLLEKNTPGIRETMDAVWRFDGRLYCRQPEDTDYLSVRLGSGSTPALREIRYKKQDFRNFEDPMTLWPEQLAEKYKYVSPAPVLLSLKENSLVGLSGSSEQSYPQARKLMMELCVNHSYQNLKIAAFFSETSAPMWEWLKWMPHAQLEDEGPRLLACDEKSSKNLMEILFRELSEREGQRSGSQKKLFATHFVVFIFESFDIFRHPVSRFFQPNDLGFTFVFLRQQEELLPPCQQLVRYASGSGTLLAAEDGEKVRSFSVEELSESEIARAARKLTCVRMDEVDLASQLTRNISLYRLLKIFSASDLDLNARWQSSAVYETMAAPLGVDAKGEVVALDLHEKAHGPHGLVAGTTGSGKSEILQSYILSMASLFHPYEVGFLIIDFKGGSMVNQFRSLPHLIGSITDIDGKEIDRSLMSIRAELNKRKALFAQAEVNHIDAYIKKYKAGEMATPLPHLILIVDEFAELKTEQPEFMKELISTARIGRSLGVHLILATQKPSGVVDAQIWSNSRFRLCLKVATPEDSKEMLKTPLAAEIREPGRAYLQVGNNEIFELFQSAYSGARSDSEIATGQREYRIDQVSLTGEERPVFIHKPSKPTADAETQLQEMVDMIARHCETNHIRRLPGICLPPLEERYLLPEKFGGEGDSPEILVSLGILDAPERQWQGEVTVNLTSQNLIVIGAAQYGKSNLLQIILCQLAKRYSPREVTFYIMDFASLSLVNYAELPHVGGVVCPGEDEKFKNLMKLLSETMEERKKKLLEIGVTSFSAYREAGFRDMPLIVVMIDNLTSLKEFYLQDDSLLLGMLRDGLTLGISFVVANAQTSGISFRYLSSFSARLAFSCNENGEYGTLFGYSRTEPHHLPGRFLVEQENKLYEAQAYLAFEGEKEIDRVQKINRFVRDSQSHWKGLHARRIPVIPERFTLSDMEQECFQLSQPYQVPLGLDYDTIQAVTMDMNSVGALGLVGRPQMGRTNWLKVMAAVLTSNQKTAPASLYIVDGVDRKLADFEKYPITRSYSVLAQDALTVLGQFGSELKRRYDLLAENKAEEMLQSELLILLIRNPEAAAKIAGDLTSMALYRDIIGKYHGLRVCILFANIDNAMVPFSAPEPYKLLRDHKSYLVFEDLPNLKVFDPPIALLRRYKRPMEAGDAFYFNENECTKVRTPLLDR